MQTNVLVVGKTAFISTLTGNSDSRPNDIFFLEQLRPLRLIFGNYTPHSSASTCGRGNIKDRRPAAEREKKKFSLFPNAIRRSKTTGNHLAELALGRRCLLRLD